MFKKLFWPKQCVPTRVYVIFWAISFVYMLVVVALAHRALKKMKESKEFLDMDDSVLRVLYSKIVISGIVGSILILFVNSYLFNMMCGEEGKPSRQVMSAVLGYLIVTPIVASLIMGVTSRLIMGKDKGLFDLIMKMTDKARKPIPEPNPEPEPQPNPQPDPGPQPTLFY